MCFGPTSETYDIVAYLDDLLILNQSKTDLQKDRKKCINLLLSLGFIINVEKSNLESSQAIVYIGTIFLLNVGLVKPTEERIQKLQKAVWSILRGQNRATDFLHLLGIIASCIEIIPKARLFMRPIQLHILAFLETKFSKFREKNSYHKSFKNASKLVVKQKQSVKRKVNSSKTGPGHCDNRCIKNRVWRSHALQSSPRRMVRETKKLAHKSFRDGGSVSNSKTLPKVPSRSDSVDQNRQHNRGTIRKQTGRYQVPSAMLQNVGSVELGNRTQHSVKSGPRSRKGQHTGRQTKSVQNITNRMDVEQSDSSTNFSHFGISPCGPLCVKSEQQTFIVHGSTSPKPLA